MAQPARLIREVAHELDIDGIGITDAPELFEAIQRVDQLKARHPDVSDAYKGFHFEKFFAPRRHLKSVRSIISAFQCHFTGDAGPVEPTSGVIASYTRSNHYEDLRRKLKELANFISREFGARAKVFSCYVSLAEKPIAERAGIGFYGKNGIIVTPSFGSMVVIGEILTDLELEPDEPIPESCKDCSICIEACPTRAIIHPYVVDRTKCLQYMSERRCTIPMEIRQIWGNRLYGCTICQDVCPRNASVRPVKRRVEIGRVGSAIPLEEIINIDQVTFETRFANNQIGMRERNAIRRNAIIAAGNSLSEAVLPPLLIAAEDPDPMIRQHAYWAITRLTGRRARGLLEKALASERSHKIKEEIKTMLDGLDTLG